MLSLLLPIFLAQSNSETLIPKNSLYLEIGGNAGYYSFNYERIIYRKGVFDFGARVGIAILPHKIGSKTYWESLVPLELIGLLGRSKHHLEIGLGYTQSYAAVAKPSTTSIGFGFDNYDYGSAMFFRIGYRYQKPEGGLLFRIGLTPYIDFANGGREEKTFVPIFAGISIGKNF